MESSDDEFELELADVEEDEEDLPFEVDSSTDEYVGRSSTFKWTTAEPAVQDMLQFDNAKAGFTDDFGKIKTPKDAFLEFLDPGIIDMVCEYSNAEGRSRDPEFRQTNSVEFLAWISLLVRAGESHQNRTHINVLWTSDTVFGQPFFTTVMSRKRYQELFKYVR